MAVTSRNLGAVRLFSGLSTDPRPGLTEADYGSQMILTDKRVLLVWNGDQWFPHSGGRVILDARNVYNPRASANGAADQDYVTLANVRVPAELVTLNSLLRIQSFWQYTSSASTKKFAHYCEGVKLFELSATTTKHAAVMNSMYWLVDLQHGYVPQFNGEHGNTNTATVVCTEDFTQDRMISFACAWGAAAASETITLDRYLVELIL